jgi:hypothetical protein
MTAVSDGLYDQVEAGLRAAGLEVVPYEVLSSQPAFQKYTRNYVSGPQEVDIGGKSDRNSAVEGRAVVISAKGRPFSTDCRVQNPSQTGERIQLSYQLKDIYLLSVNTLIDFANATAKGGLLSGARAKLDYGQYVVPGITQYHFTGIMQPMYVNVWLKQAIVAPASPFTLGGTTQTTVEHDASIDGSQASRSTTTASDVGFDADVYYSNAASHLEAANDMFLEVLKSL